MDEWMARRPGAAPDGRSFGDSAAQAGARRFMFLEMERPAGIAPASPGWKPSVLLLDDGRIILNLPRPDTAPRMIYLYIISSLRIWMDFHDDPRTGRGACHQAGACDILPSGEQPVLVCHVTFPSSVFG